MATIPAPNREQRRDNIPADRLRTAAELAEHLGVTRQTVYNQLKIGMPSIKVGRARRFRLADVDAWLDGQQTGSGDAA